MKVTPSAGLAGQRQLTEIADPPIPKGHETISLPQSPQSVPEVELKQDPYDLEDAVEKMNEVAHIFQRSLQFEVVGSNRIVIRVVDTESGEVIRQVPPQELLDAFSRMEEALGLLLDERA